MILIFNRSPSFLLLVTLSFLILSMNNICIFRGPTHAKVTPSTEVTPKLFPFSVFNFLFLRFRLINFCLLRNQIQIAISGKFAFIEIILNGTRHLAGRHRFQIPNELFISLFRSPSCIFVPLSINCLEILCFHIVYLLAVN